MDYKHWCRPVAVGIRSTDPSTAMAEATTGVRRSELVCNLRAGDLGGCARAVAYGKKFAYVNAPEGCQRGTHTYGTAYLLLPTRYLRKYTHTNTSPTG